MTTRKRRTGGTRQRAHAHAHAHRETSHPTGRNAYTDTRRWLLEEHGPVCAYCGLEYSPRSITLDHVTPRKGQSAYDRRDNLVLACKRCNAAKADKPFLVYLLGNRMRAANMFRYGQHLSAGILRHVRPLAEGLLPAAPVAARTARVRYGSEDGDSPYLDSPYRDRQ